MMTDFFKNIPPVTFEGPDSTNEFAFRHYNADEVVLGKRMEDHLRFAVAYWHSFAWQGGDPFGGQTFERPWFGETMAMAKLKADVAFEMFDILGVPFYAFHDADARPPRAVRCRAETPWVRHNQAAGTDSTRARDRCNQTPNARETRCRPSESLSFGGCAAVFS